MAFVDLTRRTRSAALVLLAALSALVLGPFLVPSPACAGTAIRFTLDRKIDGPAAPFFVAVDKGYFKDEGLDVTIDVAPSGPLEVLNRLATGKADMGVSDVNLLIKFRDANGAPIKAVKTPSLISGPRWISRTAMSASKSSSAPKSAAGRRMRPG